MTRVPALPPSSELDAPRVEAALVQLIRLLAKKTSQDVLRDASENEETYPNAANANANANEKE